MSLKRSLAQDRLPESRRWGKDGPIGDGLSLFCAEVDAFADNVSPDHRAVSHYWPNPICLEDTNYIENPDI